MSKEGKVATRYKVKDPKPSCPVCGTDMVDAEYYPSDGGTYDVLLCGGCQLVVLRSGEVVKLP